MPAFQSYIICTSPRSGSTLLCELLKTTGIAGRPGSHFHAPSLRRWLEVFGLAADRFASRQASLEAVFSAAREKGTGSNNLFGLRMQGGSFPYFMEQVRHLHPGLRTDVDGIQAVFGPTLFISLKRYDKLAQAVSRVIAEQTGLWHRAADGSELERLGPAKEAIYDREAIERQVVELTVLDRQWDEWFSGQGLEPFRTSYEKLAEAPQEVLAQVLDALGLTPEIADSIPTPTARLADTTSRRWIERYTAETQG